MTSKDIAQKLVEAVKATPEVAQELIADPSGAVARVAGATDGFDLTEVVQEALALAADLRLDLSCVDLGKLDLSQIDVAKLDLVRLASVASACNVDMTKLDMGAVTVKLLGGVVFGSRVGLRAVPFFNLACRQKCRLGYSQMDTQAGIYRLLARKTDLGIDRCIPKSVLLGRREERAARTSRRAALLGYLITRTR